jgi:methyl-accepting chemotaxis protein-1 (serine sensor receptor)
MMTVVLDELRRRGLPGVHLGVGTVNARAQAFYRKLGFAELCRVGGADGCTYMGLRLDAPPAAAAERFTRRLLPRTPPLLRRFADAAICPFDESPRMKSVSASDIASLRQSFMNLASLMLLMVLCVGILGLFSVWSLRGYQARVQAALSEVTATMDLGRQAQLHFKIQVQEWKNILLRGHGLSDRALYVAAFEKEKAVTLNLLQSLRPRVDQIQKSEGLMRLTKTQDVSAQLRGEIDQIVTGFAELNQTYKKALDEAQKNGGWDPRVADAIVRGVDRDLTVQMDAVPVELERAYKDLVSLAALAADARFETLTRIVWTGVILALSVVAFMLWRMLKHPALVK